MSALTTMLFVPAGDERKLAKVPDLDADALILDLEDAVALAKKAEARSRAAQVISRGAAAVPVYVRVNDVESGLLLDDLEAVVERGLAGIVLPKVESGRQVEIATWLLTALEERRGLVEGSVALLPIVETPRGVLRVRDIAQASARVTNLCFGAGDFSLYAGLEWPPPGSQSPTLVAAKAALVMASSAYGLGAPHDSVFPDFQDAVRLRREAEEAKALGFGAKHVIHPAQVDVVRSVFKASPEELNWAERVVAAFEEQEGAGVANVSLDGRLVDYPVYERARRVLGRAPAGGARD